VYCGGAPSVADYRGGGISGVFRRTRHGYGPLTCADDTVAIDLAKRMVIRHGIELWSGARLVLRLGPP
jgi:hypothetical protein